jgi:ABC-type sugar transport system ATPase subunit
MAKVILQDIVKTYKSQNKSQNKSQSVVKGINLEIESGEFLVLLGPSGCGKSTTLRMIAGLEEITSGKLFIGEKEVNNLSPKERNLAMVFQNYALYPHMSVYDNISFSLKIAGASKEEIKKRVDEVSSILGLDQLLKRRPAQLSGGQRQRVAMGRAIIRRPDVFLFDEPLSNLDAKLRIQMRSEIKKLHQALKTTTIYVTHDQVEAMTLADRIVIMKDGQIEQVGKPMDIYRHPKSLFVASFIGNPPMNLIKDHPQFKGKIIGVRPEHLRLETSDVAFLGTIELVEPLGGETLVHFLMGDQSIVARLNGDHFFSPNSPIQFYSTTESLSTFEV